MASEMRLQETQAGTTEHKLMQMHRPGAHSHCCRALVLTWTWTRWAPLPPRTDHLRLTAMPAARVVARWWLTAQ